MIRSAVSTSTLTPEQLLAELPKHTFEDYASFEATLIDAFNDHRFDFPPGYGWRDVLEWGLRSNMIRRKGSHIVVSRD